MRTDYKFNSIQSDSSKTIVKYTIFEGDYAASKYERAGILSSGTLEFTPSKTIDNFRKELNKELKKDKDREAIDEQKDTSGQSQTIR